MHSCILDRNWSNRNRKGVAQTYEQLNYTSSLSALRKLSVPIPESGTVIAPRNLHGSHWFVVCPAESPEGKKCGVIKAIALLSQITLKTEVNISELFSDDILPLDNRRCKLFVNGDLVGVLECHGDFIAKFISMRREGMFIGASISYVEKENVVYIWSDAGRLIRPVLVVENGEHLFTKDHAEKLKNGDLIWSDLIQNGIVELIDKSEDKGLFIASSIDTITDEHTHAEIDPALMFGVAGSLIPFPDHNQSPRNCYQCAMSKQAIGRHALNTDQVMSGIFNTLDTPQKPLTKTRASTATHYDDLPSGQNAIVAIAQLEGFGQEDSIIMNGSSIDRGFMRMTRYYTFVASIKTYDGELFRIPSDEDCVRLSGNPDKLEEDCCAGPGQRVVKGDILIGKVRRTKDGMKEYVDCSITYDHHFPGVVRKVQYGTDGDGNPYIRMSVTQTRTPAIGDKFASRAAQKGTVGMIYRQEDLPFTNEGITPDIIMNPLALPSRMTIGQLIECLSGKALVCENKGDEVLDESITSLFSDCTPFRKKFSLENIVERLRSLGYDGLGKEMMINGMTGEPMESLIFIGPVYYQRLKHMVIDKIHARSRGGRTNITRQPTEGRSLGGGLRIGVMEVDTLSAQGASNFLVDRLMEQSDEFKMWVCEICGLPAIHDGEEGCCNVCNTTKVKQIRIPYGTKLLTQELMGMGIATRMLV
jgi:DNA-directed RNA polymerase II subunit RPB2